MFDPEFFPTPSAITSKMLDKISEDARYFLEPSAGKGDIADFIANTHFAHSRRTVDCIEQSPELVAILTDKNHPVVGFDWLTYDGVCYYDAIVMNPPFSNGDAHLLKAWDFLHSGEIVCLLNAETITNPHTASRERLKGIIEQHGHMEMLGKCFARAERKTDAEIAMVYLKKVGEDDGAELWDIKTKEKDHGGEGNPDNLLAIKDNLGNMQHYYEQANHHMAEAFRHIRKAGVYMSGNSLSVSDYQDVIKLAGGNFNEAKAAFARKHRNDAWHMVFGKAEFRKWLDKKQADEFHRDIERHGNIPFTAANIKGTLENVFLSRQKLFEQSAANVFDELRKYHPDNCHHTEGWKSNSGYKINRKIVFPYGCEFEDKYMHSFRLSWGGNLDIYNDLDRVLSVLDSQDFSNCHTVGQALENKFRILGYGVKSPFSNTTESRYFEIKFFKKGTVHLYFKDEKLWNDFNKTAATGRNEIGEEAA